MPAEKSNKFLPNKNKRNAVARFKNSKDKWIAPWLSPKNDKTPAYIKKPREILCLEIRCKTELPEATAEPYTHIPLHPVLEGLPKVKFGPIQQHLGELRIFLEVVSFDKFFEAVYILLKSLIVLLTSSWSRVINIIVKTLRILKPNVVSQLLLPTIYSIKEPPLVASSLKRMPSTS